MLSLSMLIIQEGWAPIPPVRDRTYESGLREQDILPGTGDKQTHYTSFAKVRRLRPLPGLAVVT